MLIKCKSCGELVSHKAPKCPHCGAVVINEICCQECKTVYYADLEVCPHCGMRTPVNMSSKITVFIAKMVSFFKSRKFWVPVVIILIISLCGVGIYFFQIISEKMLWNKIQRGQILICEEYLDKFPEGKHAEEVRTIFLDYRKEQADWSVALNRNNVTSYLDFVYRHPNSSNCVKAKRLADSIAWENAVVENSEAAYRNYLNVIVDGIHSSEAKGKIDNFVLHTLSSYEEENAKEIVQNFFTAIENNNEETVLQYLPTYFKFNGKTVGKAYILKYMKSLHPDDVYRMSISTNNYFVDKFVADDCTMSYQVKCSVDMISNRHDNEKETYRNSEGIILVDENNLISSVSLQVKSSY